MPILAQAKWLVRPEYCRYSRSSTAGTSHTGGVSSYLFLFLCFAMADLPIQDIDIGQVMAMAAAQQRKVEEWCNAQGIETEADLAYMFTSHSEALREAGSGGRLVSFKGECAERAGCADPSDRAGGRGGAQACSFCCGA